MSDRKIIETYPAGEFVCDNCGRNSYFSLVSVKSQLSPEEMKEFYQKLHGTKPPDETEAAWLVHPSTVKCQHCGTEYDTFQGLMEDEITDIENEDA
jgi:protein-arginine kinase activator protein McsA